MAGENKLIRINLRQRTAEAERFRTPASAGIAQFFSRKTGRGTSMNLMECPFSQKRPAMVRRRHRSRIKIEINQPATGLFIALVKAADFLKQIAAEEETVRLRGRL